ncbi:MAG TPA: hypothetical protein VF221_19705 [Chloroflexota bacterium]
MADDTPAGQLEERAGPSRDPEQDGRIVRMRDVGASWLEVQQAFGLSRQQARYAYQRGKREERRAQRRSQLISD